MYIAGNEWADRSSRAGAKHSFKSKEVFISWSLQEGYSLLQKVSFEQIEKKYIDDVLPKIHKPNSSMKCCSNAQTHIFAKKIR